MAIQDNIQAVSTEEQIKVYKERVANSIRFRQESVKMTKQKYAELMEKVAQREEMMSKLKETVQENAEKGISYEAVIGKNTVYAAKIAALEEQINILGIVPGPMEFIGNRAIRLIDKMYKESIASSNGIYAEFVSEQHPMTETFNDLEAVQKVQETNEEVPSINVEKIAEDNKKVIDESVETAISEEESLKDNSINENVVDQKVEEETNNNVFDLNEITRIINEKLEEAYKNNNEESVVPTVVPTEEDVTKEREDNLLAQYYGLNEAHEIEKQEVAAVNESKEFNFNNAVALESEPVEAVEVDSNDEQIRDEIIAVPEREEVVEEKINDQIAVAESAVVDTIETRSMVMTSEEKEKAREVMEKVRAARKRREELEKEVSSVDSDIENQKEINAQVAAKEEEAKKALEKSTAEANEAEQAYVDAVNALEKEFADLSSENDAMTNSIESKREELANIQEDTASKNKVIESLDSENKTKQEEIAKYKELREMLHYDEEDSIIEKQKVA